ncbi:MAG: subclass B3 metallo-beta-lactamase [Parerythrobacter sp.]
MFDRCLPTALGATALALSACTATTQVTPAVVRPAADQMAWAAACDDWDGWDKPGPAFRIHGNTYYVGTCGISAILVADPAGHILIDSGTDPGAKVVLANIRALGFDPADVRYLLHSHEHFDHVGGHARIAAATSAQVIASEAAAIVLGSGTVAHNDPQAAIHPPMQPVSVNGIVLDGQTVASGDAVLTAIETPGHSPGALSWQWDSCDDGEDCVSLVFADSLFPISADGYSFLDNPAYLSAFEQGLGRVATLRCDILLTPHPSASKMPVRLAGTAPLRNAEACRQYAADIGAKLEERLDKEAG